MEFTNEQKELIKKLQKLILSNVICCESDVRPNIISRFKEVNYRNLTEKEMKELNVPDTAAGYFEILTDSICINPKLANANNFEHILLHEMLHAHSYDKQFGTGYSYVTMQETSKFDNVIVKRHNILINEAATEYYASVFKNEPTISYQLLIPIYQHFSDVCGFEKLMTYYFSNDYKKLYETIVDKYHLKDDYLVKKLFMQIEQGFDYKTSSVNWPALVETYQTLVEINIQKLNFENGTKLNNTELLEKLNFNKILSINDEINVSVAKYLELIKKNMKKYIFTRKDYEEKIDFDLISTIVDNFVFHRLNATKDVDYQLYKNFFNDNLCDVLLYLDQNVEYIFDGHAMNPDLAINEVLSFLRDERGIISLKHLSKNERHRFVNLYVNNCKHDIHNFEKQIDIADIVSELEDNSEVLALTKQN